MPWRYPPHLFDLHPWPVRRTISRPANRPPNYSSSDDENEYEEGDLENPRYLYGGTPPLGLYADYVAEPEEPRSPGGHTPAGTPYTWIRAHMRHLNDDGAREMTRLILDERSVEEALFGGLEYQENQHEREQRRQDMRVMDRAQHVMYRQRRDLMHHWQIIRLGLERLLETIDGEPPEFACNMMTTMTDVMATIDTPPGALEIHPPIVNPTIRRSLRAQLRELCRRGLISQELVPALRQWSRVWNLRGESMERWHGVFVGDPETIRVAEEAGLEPEDEDVMLFRTRWMTAESFYDMHP